MNVLVPGAKVLKSKLTAAGMPPEDPGSVPAFAAELEAEFTG
jgi:hypothetical protein